MNVLGKNILEDQRISVAEIDDGVEARQSDVGFAVGNEMKALEAREIVDVMVLARDPEIGDRVRTRTILEDERFSAGAARQGIAAPPISVPSPPLNVLAPALPVSV